MLEIDSVFDAPQFDLVQRKLQSSLDNGVRILCTEQDLQAKDELKKLSDKMLMYYGVNNPFSTKETVQYTMNHLTEDIIQWCVEGGEIKLRSETMRKVKDSEFITDLLKYRQLKYRVQNFLPNNTIVHPTVIRSTTNRILYKQPNILNRDKYNVKPPSEDEYIVCVRIPNQELVVWHEMLGLTELRPYFRTIDDPYRGMYEHFYHKPPMDKALAEFKKFWTAASYGLPLGNVIYTQADPTVIADYLGQQHIVKTLNQITKYAFKAKNTCKSYFGTVLSPGTKELTSIQAIILTIQGTVSDIMTILLEHCYSELSKGKYADDIHVLYTRYNKILFRVSDHVPRVDAMKYIMELTAHRVDDWQEFAREITNF